MIIRPNFLRHPKTLLLLELLGAEGVCRLLSGWTWCQESGWGEFWPKADRGYVERICGWRGKAGKLSDALVKSGYLKFTREGALWINWNQNNHAMVNNWKNGQFGKLGGRPKKQKKPSGLPSGLPSGQPTALPSGPPEERRGEEIQSTKGGVPPLESPSKNHIANSSPSSNGPGPKLAKGTRARERYLEELRSRFVTLRAQLRDYQKIPQPTEAQLGVIAELNDMLRRLRQEQREFEKHDKK